MFSTTFLLNMLIDLIARLQNFVQIMLADDVSQAGEGDLLDGNAKIFDIQNGLLRVADAIPEYRIHFYRDAIARDGFLLLDRSGNHAEVDAGFVFDSERNQPEQARTAQPGIAPQSKHDGALVFSRDAQTREQNQQHDERRDAGQIHTSKRTTQVRCGRAVGHLLN